MAAEQARTFDLIVVGCGPAGMAAAYTAAKAGLSVCALDKSSFPRDKLCGGLLTERSRRIFQSTFDRPWDPGLTTTSDHVVFLMKNRRLAELAGYSELHFTMRREFDAHLVEIAEKAGVEMRLNVQIETMDFASQRLTFSDGEPLTYRRLIGADGVNSRVGQLLFGQAFDPRTIGFGLEVEVPLEDLATQGRVVEIDFGTVNWGYGWVFPKKKTFTIGVGGVHRANPQLREALSDYLAAKGLEPTAYRVKGQYIPFGDFHAHPGQGNVLLCGDAAGFVDPVTGEGIAYAIESGALAARAIVNALQGDGSSALPAYERGIARIASSLRQARWWRQFIFAAWARAPFSALFADAGTLQRGYLDILAGNRGYEDLPALFVEQAKRALRKLARHAMARDRPKQDAGGRGE